jgi:hypothetical protein
MARRAALVPPVSTTMGRKWRWDRFAVKESAQAWYDARRAEGHRVFLRGVFVAWDQTSKPVAPRTTRRPRKVYPKTKIDHCHYCQERRTFTRTGPGGPDPRPTYARAGFQQYHYTEDPRHMCEGMAKAEARMREVSARITERLRGVVYDSMVQHTKRRKRK